MFKKLNHKIFNLIIMIIISIVLLAIPNVCKATEYFSIDSPYLLADQSTTTDSTQSGFQTLAPVETDYLPEEDPDEEKSVNDTLFSSVNRSSFTREIKKNVAQWYYIFRYIAIAIMLVLLIILAIKMAITSIAEQKALYKRMLVDWVVCFILLFFIHYFMIFVLYINESIIDLVKSVSIANSTNGEYSLYETVRSRAYDFKFTVGLTGAILYMNLVWFTCKFVYIYAKRFITMIILTVIAPVIVLFYSLKKVLTGSSKVLTKWMEEYALNVLLQAIHALLYAVFVGIALKLTESSLIGIIISLIILNFMSKADKIFREIFKFSDGSALADENSEAQMSDLVDTAKNAALLGVAAKNLKNMPGVSAVNKAAGAVAKNVVAKPLIHTASALTNSTPGQFIGDKASKASESFSKWRNNRYDKKIADYGNRIKSISEQLKNDGSTMTDEQKLKFAKNLKNYSKEHMKANRKKSNYNARRNMFKRLGQVLDPDTYMEYVYDDAEYDENGNIIKDRQIKKNIFGNYKRRVIKNKKIYNSQTGKYETIESLSTVFKDAKKKVFDLTDEDKAVLNEAKELAKNGLLGVGGMMIGMSAIADNPALGFALLASGISRTKKISTRNKKGFKVTRKARRALRKAAKQEKKEYTFKAFSTSALLNIDQIIRELAKTDPDVGRLNYLISQIENGGYKLATLPFKLTGTKGVLLNILDIQRNIAEQHKKDINDYERDVSVELMKSITGDVISQHNTVYQRLETYIEQEDIFELIEQREIRNCNIFTVTSAVDGTQKQFKFGTDIYSAGATTKDRINNAIINTAMKMNVYDVGKLNFRNQETKKALIAELKREGIIDKDIEESRENINEIIFGKDGSKGMIYASRKLARKDPNVVKNRVYKEITRDYMISNGVTTLSDQDKSTIRDLYTSRINTNNAKANFDTLLVSMAVGSGNSNIQNLSAQDILGLASGDTYQSRINLFKQSVEATNDYGHGNDELFYKLGAVSQGNQINLTDGFREVIEKREKELNQTINDAIVGALANNNIMDPSFLIASPTDAKSLAFKADVKNLLRFAGLQNSEDELQQIVDDKINSITSEDIESAIIRDETQRYINEEFNGDFEAFKNALQSDEDMQKEFEEKILERLKIANKDTSKEKEIDGVLDLIRGGKVSDKTIAESKNAVLNDTFVKEDEAIRLPYPEVKTNIKVDCILYSFYLPNSDEAKDCTIELCKIEADGNKGRWIQIDHVDLREDEKIIVRLVKNGKHGPALVLSYPKPISDVVTQIGKNKKQKTKDVDDVERSVMSKMKKYDSTGTAEERFGREVVTSVIDPDIEKLFRDSEKTSAVNNISTVMDSILDYRKRIEPGDSNVEEILEEAVDTFDSMVNNNANNRDEYIADANKLLDLLLQQKYAADDAEAIKIKKDKRKNKKYRQSILDEREVTSKNIANADFERLISSLNS